MYLNICLYIKCVLKKFEKKKTSIYEASTKNIRTENNKEEIMPIL